MDTLTFCRDGILRRHFFAYNHNTRQSVSEDVPLLAWEKAVDPHIFLKSLSSDIAFEKGLTVGEMMENLAPWAETMIGVGVLDFPEFLAEMRKEPQRLVTTVEKIVLRYRASINAVPAYERRFNDKGQEMMFGGAPKKTGKLSLQQGWDMDAMLKEEARHEFDGAETIAIDYTPLSEWKHLTIEIDEEGIFEDETACSLSRGFLHSDQPITQAAHPNVSLVKNGHGKVWRHRMVVDAPSPTFYEALIHSFFWEVGFSYSPAQRDEFTEMIHERVEEIESGTSKSIPVQDIILNDEERPREHRPEKDEEFEYEIALLERVRAAAEELGLPFREKPEEA